MGLDAAVYRNISRFSDLGGPEVDPGTGEVFSRSVGQSLSPSAIAIERRLGNVDEIREIRSVVQALLNRSDGRGDPRSGPARDRHARRPPPLPAATAPRSLSSI
jgi:hypothetical protein